MKPLFPGSLIRHCCSPPFKASWGKANCMTSCFELSFISDRLNASRWNKPLHPGRLTAGTWSHDGLEEENSFSIGWVFRFHVNLPGCTPWKNITRENNNFQMYLLSNILIFQSAMLAYWKIRFPTKNICHLQKGQWLKMKKCFTYAVRLRSSLINFLTSTWAIPSMPAMLKSVTTSIYTTHPETNSSPVKIKWVESMNFL